MDGCANCGEQFKRRPHGYDRWNLDTNVQIGFVGSQGQPPSEPMQVTARQALENMTGLSFVTFGNSKRQGEFLCLRCLGLLKFGYRCCCAMNEFWRLTSEDSYLMHCLSQDYLHELQSGASFREDMTMPAPSTDANRKPYPRSFLNKKPKKSSKWNTIAGYIQKRRYPLAVRGIYRATAGSKRQFLNVVKKEVRREVKSLFLSDICLCQKANLMSTPEDIPWDEVIEELRDKAPLLHTVLIGAVSAGKTEHDLRRGHNRQVDLKPMIGTALSILLYAKYPVKANYLPTTISLLLRRKRSKQKTISLLSKLGLCFGPHGTDVCFKRLKEEFDLAMSDCPIGDENVVEGERYSPTLNGTEEECLDSQVLNSVEDASLDSSFVNDEEVTSALSPPGHIEPDVNMMLGENEPEFETDISETDISSDEDEIYTDDDEPCTENGHISDKIPVNMSTEEYRGSGYDFEQSREESLDPGFTLSWDNVCNRMIASHPHVDQQNAKVKYSLGYLAVNRIPTVRLDNSDRTTISASDIPFTVFTPSVRDFHELQSRMTVIVSRILTRHLQWFSEFFDDCTVEHVSHNHSLESVQRSLLMNLGALDESSTDANTDVINCVQKYIAKGSDHSVPAVIFRDSSNFGCDSRDNDVLRVETLISDAQEFRKEILLLEDYYNDFLKETSFEEKGTLRQIMNMINFSDDKLNSFLQRWDLMCEATEAFVILSAMEVMGLKTTSDRPPSAVKALEACSLQKRRSFLDAVSKQIVQSIWHEMDTDALTISPSEGVADYCCNEDRDEGVVRCKSGRGCIKGELFHYSCAGVTLHQQLDEWYCSEECEQKSKKTFKYCMCSQDMGDVAMVGCAAQDDCLLKEWYHLECIGFSEEELPSCEWYCTEECKLLYEDESVRQSSRLVKKRRTNTTYLPDFKFRYNTALAWRGLNLLCRRDAVREGDGDAMLSYWVMDLVDFYRTGKFESVTSAHRLLSSVNGWLPEKIGHDLRWNRTVNFTGGSGRNIPADLMNDILNRLFNDLPKSRRDCFVSKISDDANPSLDLCEDSIDVVFDPKKIQREVKLHTRRNADIDKNVRMIVKSLRGEDLFKVVPGRQYKAFPMFKYDSSPKPEGKFGFELVRLAKRLDSIRFT
ncbi:uncharacterized protein LOC135479677 [Liolophura sinensis]|uniref:uncharacterized protein LOC135479677 n=1 Tax=Liolophura sinensis TaxID=3198878 RepID=UPI003158A7FD